MIRVSEGTDQSNGHHFTDPDPDRVVDFILANTSPEQNFPVHSLTESTRIVFLGDSITYAEGYVAAKVEAAGAKLVEYVNRRRIDEPEFTFQSDSVHPNAAGHLFIASQLSRAPGDQSLSVDDPDDLLLSNRFEQETWLKVREGMIVRRDAYLSTAGHTRPGIAAGLSIEQAELKAAELTEITQSIESAESDK